MDTNKNPNTKKLLLHSCCAPCSIVPLDVFRHDGFEVAAAYINPNIHPDEEYQKRLDTFVAYADACELPVLASSNDFEAWEEQVGCFGGPYPLIEGTKGAAESHCSAGSKGSADYGDTTDYKDNLCARRKRCRACYRLRFEQAALLAKEQGFEYLATTLTISPYQFTEIIFEELEAAAHKYGLTPLCVDFKEQYPRATLRSKELGMYRQNYCGCRFSQEEARLEREARKKARKEMQLKAQLEPEQKEAQKEARLQARQKPQLSEQQQGSSC
ncbi:MAG: epoxyqueuosine reductase QueH [Coriobacteriales bacterium]|nr:epoxyqueuosine reductase QueH [Coriobacteriales bacterium]